jgi:hypothetical protein
MTSGLLRRIALICFTALILVGWGCSESPLENGNGYLIRVGDHVLTAVDFKAAFEIAKSAYPHNEMQTPAAYKTAQSRVLNQLAEELILLKRAGELGIFISESEINSAVSKIREDYPDNAFEEVLLEHAVSYEAWKKRLKIRLLMEKVVKAELKDNISITPEDILSYYERHYRLNPQMQKDRENINARIVDQLRRKKAENAYRAWIKQLHDRYSIQINTKLWKRVVGS